MPDPTTNKKLARKIVNWKATLAGPTAAGPVGCRSTPSRTSAEEGHILPYEQPGEVSDRVREFLG